MTLGLLPLKQDLWSCILRAAVAIQIWYRYLLQHQKWYLPIPDCKVIEVSLKLQQLCQSFTHTWDFSLEFFYYFKVKIHFQNLGFVHTMVEKGNNQTYEHFRRFPEFSTKIHWTIKNQNPGSFLQGFLSEYCRMVSLLRWSCYYYSPGIC